jgi:hypothetical protein
MKHVRKNDVQAIAALVGAGAMLALLIMLGQFYIKECRAQKGDFERCWDKGLAIAGMGEGGPLSAAVVIGYILGTLDKEREKQRKFEEGYNTYNPDLHPESHDEKPIGEH